MALDESNGIQATMPVMPGYGNYGGADERSTE